MSELWNVDVRHWWLPNEEGLPPVIRAIKEFIEYRAQRPKNALQADVREMSGIFRDMGVSDRNTGTDSEPALNPSGRWESSPEQPWT
jgi:hypothetical protein